MRRKMSFLILAVILVAGCNRKLNDERNKDLETGTDWSIILEPAKFKQTIKVTIQSPDAPVTAWIFLEKDKNDAMPAIDNDKTSDTILAKEVKIEEVTLTAEIPPKEGVIIYILNTSGKKAAVKVTTTN